MKIRNNVASLNALRHAGKNFDHVKSSIEKLSSGLKINQAKDSPANLIASERLRGTVAGLKQAQDNVSFAVSLYQHTEGALNEVSDTLVRMKQLSVHAANEAVNDDAMLAADQQEMENLLNSLDRIVQNTTFNGKKLLDGTQGANGTTVGDHLRFVSADVSTPGSPEEGFEVDINQVATRATKSGGVPLTVDNIEDGLYVLVTESGRNAELDTRVGKLKEDIGNILKSYHENPARFPADQMSADIRGIVVHHLQKSIDENGLELDIFEGPNQTFTLRHRKYGDEPSFSVTANIPGIFTRDENIAESSKPGVDVAGTIAGATAKGDGQYLTALEGSPAQGVTIQFTRTIEMKEVPVFQEKSVPVYDESGVQTGTEIVKERVGTDFIEETQDEVVGSPQEPNVEGYVHLSQQTKNVNLGPLAGNEAGVSLKDIRTTKLAQGVETESGFRSLADIDLTSLQGAHDANRIIDKAIDEISQFRAKIGSFQKNTVERNLNTLKVAEETATEGESTLRDADMAEEMSKLTSNQILLSASQTMLAQANQLPGNVLQLLESNQ